MIFYQYLGDAVKNVYVRHDPESDDAIGRTIVIFDVCKKGGNDGNQ